MPTFFMLFILPSFFFSYCNLYSAEEEAHPSTITLVALKNTEMGFVKQTTPLIAVLCSQQKGWSIEDETIKWSLEMALGVAKSQNAINYVDNEGCTALSIACWNKQKEICRQLLEEGACVCPADDRTPCVFIQALLLSKGVWNDELEALLPHVPDSCFLHTKKIGHSPLLAAALACAESKKNISAAVILHRKKQFTLKDFEKIGTNGFSPRTAIELSNNKILKLWWSTIKLRPYK